MLALCPHIQTGKFRGTFRSSITRYLHPREISLYRELRSRVQKFPALHAKAAPNGKCCEGYTWCGYKITGLMLEHLLLKKLHNINVVTLNVLPSAIPTPLYANFPLLEAMLQVVF